MDGLVGVTTIIHLKQEMIQIKILKHGLTIIQLVSLVAVFVLNYLTKTKSLVMQHVYVKRFEHMRVLTLTNRMLIAAVILVIMIVVALMLYKKGIKMLLSFVIVSFMAVVALLIPIEEWMVYSYFIGTVLFIMLLEFLKLGLKERCH